MPSFAICPASDRPALYGSRSRWESYFRLHRVWPPFLAHGQTCQRFCRFIDRWFLDFQLVAFTRDAAEVAGIAHSVPLRLEGSTCVSLPHRGWDWALATAVANRRHDVSPNALCGLSITVLPQFRRVGLGRGMVKTFIELARVKGLSTVIVPVRPLTKALEPDVDMPTFMSRIGPDGYHQDPWIRTHQEEGAQIVCICERSIEVVAPRSRWEQWCGTAIVSPGPVHVPGALVPVDIDLTMHEGIYAEPNVWMRYEVNGKAV
jgi:GNAT superfamily N-acetyltransferase